LVPRKRRILTPEKNFEIFLETCRSLGRVGEVLRREGLYHTDLARIRAAISDTLGSTPSGEKEALASLRKVRPGRRGKPPIPLEVHEALLREKEELEKAIASLAMENQALKKVWRGGSRGR
jgi:transposase-like protein